MSRKIVGASVIMPEPKARDRWQHGGFTARIIKIVGQAAIVVDQDDDHFAVELDRTRLVMTPKQRTKVRTQQNADLINL